MLSYFPRFYDDELLYSAISRYHIISGNQNYKTTVKEIFNSDKQTPILEFTSNLSNLIDKLPAEGVTESKGIIQRNTIFPLYSPFLPETRKQSIIRKMLYSDGKGLKTEIGMVAGSICSKDDLMYCPLCSKEENERYGEAYFHRLHQVQGVLVCLIHKCFLKNYPIKRNMESRVKYIRLDNSILDQRVEYVVSSDDKLIKIAQNIKYILDSDLESFNQEKIHRRYIEFLRKKGFLNVNNRIKQRKVYEKFNAFFGEDLLNRLESNIDFNNEYNWLKVLLRKPKRVVHPLRQVLFIMFICENIEQFFLNNINEDNTQRYPCLNHFCKNYNKLNVNNYKITPDYKTREPIITVKCTCGFVYSRKTNKDIYTAGRIKEYGPLWEGNLRSLLMEQKYSLRSLGRLMKCDPKTIIRYADKLKLKHLIDTNMKISYKETIVTPSISVNPEKYKEDIVNFRSINSDVCRTDIRTQLSKQYMWLYKHDKRWLNENLPPKKKRVSINKNYRVNWEKRDEDILILLKKHYNSITKMEKRSRITKSIIARRTGKLAILESHVDRLPKCKEYISEITETVEEFQIYRVNKVIKDMFFKNQELKRWEIIRKAGLRSGFSKRVAQIIDGEA